MTAQPEIVFLPVAEIQENSWNPNVMPDHVMKALVANIRRVGFNRVLVVRPNIGEGRAYELVDGEHSLRAARAAGIEFVPVVIRDMDDAEARAQTIAMNQLHGDMDPAGMAALVREIAEQGIDYSQLADFVGFTREELDAIDHLLELDFSREAEPPREPSTTPQGDDERWVDVRVRVPYTLALMFRSELDRLKDARQTTHDHLALELMVLTSANTPENQL